MTISRRDLIKVGLAAGTAVSFPSVRRAQTAPADSRTVRMVLGNLSVFDPMLTTSTDTVTHGLAIYDTLFASDSKYMPQPQMVGKWGVSDDKKIYTFELRDGLGWHDGSAVTAADCVASIRRWGQVDPGGQLIISRTKDISKKDDKTFTIALKEPLGALLDLLAKVAGPVPFMMREKDADRPATEQVTSNIGSGPFKFNGALAKPGANFTYDRNEKYVPRAETSDGLAGGKVVKVDRVIWDIGLFGNQQTAFAALQAGEVDYIGSPSPDLYPLIQSDSNIELRTPKSNQVFFMRMNCLQKPFDNVKVRQAMLSLIDQEAVMRTTYPPEYSRTITSYFGNDTFYSNRENTGWFKKGGDPEKTKQLLKEAGYAGEKIVILDPTDWAAANNMAQYLAATLRKIGANAELAPSDWGGLIARRANKGSVENGGWSIFITSESDFSRTDPVGNPTLSANGENGWYGWPKSDEYEALRAKWANVDTAERKALARKMQQVHWNFVGTVLLGEAISPTANRKSLTGLINMPDCTPMWNMQKS
ncbi:ABC transporter substrate-binding protein [Mesorhizobium sp. M0106]|uniref:ABC transporter substrate-binding protein n=1 Tax=Mesorhizobium sp. M0106 TaxID=2956880 RepID=UPI00333E00AB